MAAMLLSAHVEMAGSLSSAGFNWQGSKIQFWTSYSTRSPSGRGSEWSQSYGHGTLSIPCKAERALAATLHSNWRRSHALEIGDRRGSASDQAQVWRRKSRVQTPDSAILYYYCMAPLTLCFQPLVQPSGCSVYFRTPRACDDVGGHAVMGLQRTYLGRVLSWKD
jgi:hypothetical protein